VPRYRLLLWQRVGFADWAFWSYFLTSPVNNISHACHIFQKGRNDAETAQRIGIFSKAGLIVPLQSLKLGSWDLPSDLAIIRESNKDFISLSVHFLPSPDPGPP
jgi:hypothetical protein